MVIVRSILFNLLFFLNLAVLLLVALVTLALPRRAVLRMAELWGRVSVWLLRIVCGIERADSGQILLGGQDIAGLPPAARGFGVVFQSYALFPNLTAAQNIADDRNTSRNDRVYAPGDRPGPGHGWGSTVMQTARPRDFGALALVIAVFLVLLVVAIVLPPIGLLIGAFNMDKPARRKQSQILLGIGIGIIVLFVVTR